MTTDSAPQPRIPFIGNRVAQAYADAMHASTLDPDERLSAVQALSEYTDVPHVRAALAKFIGISRDNDMFLDVVSVAKPKPTTMLGLAAIGLMIHRGSPEEEPSPHGLALNLLMGTTIDPYYDSRQTQMSSVAAGAPYRHNSG